jgi:hypothetical protein
MPTLQDLAAGNAIAENAVNFSQQQQQYSARQQAATQAADQFKQGDIKGAYSTLMAHDPDFAKQIAPHLTSIVPEFAQSLTQGTQTGQLTAQNQFGSTPAQIAKIGADAKIQAALGKLNAGVSKDEDKLVHYTDAQGNLTFARQGDIKAQLKGGSATSAAKAGTQDSSATPATPNQTAPTDTAKPTLQVYAPPGQGVQEVDSSGNKVSLGPKQNKGLQDATKQFNKDAKPFIDSINATAGSEDLLKENIPGAQIAEKLKTIKGLVQSGRVPQQFVEEYGNGKTSGIVASIENAITEAEGGGLGAQARQNMYQLNKALQNQASSEYDALLKSRAQQASDNLKVDPFIAKQRFASVGPTPYQQTLQKVQKLSPQDQAAFNWAHDHMADKDSATSSQAKAILSHIGPQLGK